MYTKMCVFLQKRNHPDQTNKFKITPLVKPELLKQSIVLIYRKDAESITEHTLCITIKLEADKLQLLKSTQLSQLSADSEKLAYSYESQFQIDYSYYGVRILHKQHENIGPSCLLSIGQDASGVMVWVFSAPLYLLS